MPDDSLIPIELPQVLDLEAARIWREAILAAIRIQQGVAADAERVLELTTEGMQSLIVGARALSAAGLDFTLRRPSDPLIAAIEDLGLFQVVMDWTITD
jgi:hypothetical protein